MAHRKFRSHAMNLHQFWPSRDGSNLVPLRVPLAVAMTAVGVLAAPPSVADDGCAPGGPPPGAASMPVGDAYGQPATLSISNRGVVGITTVLGYGQATVEDPSPLPLRALLIDAQQNGDHQIIVSAGRDAHLYTVSGCTITTVVDQQGVPFLFDLGHRRGTGDGIGCSDLGDGRRLVGLLQIAGGGRLTVRRNEIDLNVAAVTLGRSDTVTATSDRDPAWTTAATISCGDRTIDQDGVQAHD
jgi:hypothetical protein